MKIPGAIPLFADGTLNPAAEHVVRHTDACKRKANRESGAGGQNASLQMRDMDRRCTCGHSAAGNPRAVPVGAEWGNVECGGLFVMAHEIAEIAWSEGADGAITGWRPLDGRPEDERWKVAWDVLLCCPVCKGATLEPGITCRECGTNPYQYMPPDGPVLLVPGEECSDCEGRGYLGVCRDGRKQSCERCGGSEDCLGEGVMESRLIRPAELEDPTYSTVAVMLSGVYHHIAGAAQLPDHLVATLQLTPPSDSVLVVLDRELQQLPGDIAALLWLTDPMVYVSREVVG